MQALFVKRPIYHALTRLYSAVAETMVENCIVPDVLKHLPKDVALAKVIYPPRDKEVCLGNELTPTEARCEPCVEWEAADESFYTLTMIDPDAPSRKDPKMKEWLHWAVGNIPGGCLEKGEVLAPYIGPGPPEGCGCHRYVFFIFQQRGQISFCGTRLKGDSAKGRPGFRMKDFVERYDLGNPVATNFFFAQYDEYVKKLYKKLGMASKDD